MGQSDSPTQMSTEDINNILDGFFPPTNEGVPIVEYDGEPWYPQDPMPIEIGGDPVSQAEWDNMILRMITETRGEFDRFKQLTKDYMDGITDEQGRNTLRIDSNEEEIASNARRIRTLERQVELLSQEDQNQLPPPDPEWNLTFYCDDISSCAECFQNQYNELAGLQAIFTILNSLYAQAEVTLKNKIEWGNSKANSVLGFSLGWAPVLEKLQKQRLDWARVYSQKSLELLDRLEVILQGFEQCEEEGQRRAEEQWLVDNADREDVIRVVFPPADLDRIRTLFRSYVFSNEQIAVMR